MAPADAEHGFAFIAFDCPVYTLAMLVTNLGANVQGIDRRLLTGCELVPYPSAIVVTVHTS
jgi:hypothetical protein